jgi:hypothetical protein
MSLKVETFSEASVPVRGLSSPTGYEITDETGQTFSLHVRATFGHDESDPARPVRLDVTPVAVKADTVQIAPEVGDEERATGTLPGYQVMIGSTGLRSTVVGVDRYPLGEEGNRRWAPSPVIAVEAVSGLCNMLGATVARVPSGVLGPRMIVPPTVLELSVERADGQGPLQFPGVSVSELAVAAVPAALAVIQQYPDGAVHEYTNYQPVPAY